MTWRGIGSFAVRVVLTSAKGNAMIDFCDIFAALSLSRALCRRHAVRASQLPRYMRRIILSSCCSTWKEHRVFSFGDVVHAFALVDQVNELG